MIVKAIYENNVLRPLEELDLKEGEEVEIEVKKKGLFELIRSHSLRSSTDRPACFKITLRFLSLALCEAALRRPSPLFAEQHGSRTVFWQ